MQALITKAGGNMTAGWVCIASIVYGGGLRV